MRYEDASQTGSMSNTPDARDDGDALAAGARVPATGNLISGTGTTTGALGADAVSGDARIVSISGEGGKDSSFSGGKLSVAGEHGRLTVDAEGNYNYLANKGAPESVRDTFSYELTDASGGRDTAQLVIEIGKSQSQSVQANAQQVVPGPDGVVVLPAGVELSDIMVVGRNLVITLPDGSQMVIVDGAVFVPQLVLGDVEVPAANLAALLIGSELRPAAGGEFAGLSGVQSGGGNFAVPVAPLDPGVPLGDLIPPTVLDYTPPEFDEVFDLIDNEPEILIQTPDNPAGAVDAIDEVNENGLPTRGAEPAGSNFGSNAHVTTGTIVYESPDDPNVITINGEAVTAIGQLIDGEFGTIRITSIADGAIGYEYTLDDNTIGDATQDLFTVIITDSDGDTDTATLTISIIDDVPTARPDVDSVTEDGPLVANGNVLSAVGGDDANSSDGVADTPGADGVTITGIAFGSTAGSIGGTVPGAYGSLVLNANGLYTYTLTNTNPAVQALGANETLTEVFTYTITDGDGDVRSTTLTITINGANDGPTIVAGAAIVSEEGLPAGNPDSVGLPTDLSNSATATGTLTVADVDGDALTVTLGAPAAAFTSHGVAIVWTVSADGHVLTGAAGGTPVVTITIANDGAYSVVLAGQIDHPNPAGEDVVTFGVPVTVNDGTASSSTTLTVSIEDDSPIVDSGPSVGSSVTLDETAGSDPLSSGPAISATSAAPMITAGIDFGADGPGAAPVYGLSLLGGVTSIASGLATALGDFPITLTLTSSTLITATYNDGTVKTAFTIQMNANGTITVTQNTALEHLVDGSTPEAYDDALTLAGGQLGSLVNATVTYEDFDHDTVSAATAIGGAITFRDDGPSIDVTLNAQLEPTITLTTTDDGTEGAGQTSAFTASGNFGGTFGLTFTTGADGAPTPSLAFALATTGGDSLLDSHGVAINLYLIGGKVVGSTATSIDAVTAGNTIFDVAVNASGVVTLTQYAQVDHPTEAGVNDAPFADQLASLADGAITLTASSTITDNDGDTASDSAVANIGANLRFADDGPAISAVLVTDARIRIDETDGVVAAGGEVDPVGGGNLGTVTMDANLLFTVTTDAVSADAPTLTNYALALPAQGTVSGLLLSTTNATIYLYNIGGTVVGSTSTTLDGVNAGNTVFDVSINSTSGAVTLTQYLAVEHPIGGSSHDEDSSGLNPGALMITVTATDFDNDVDSASVDLGSIIRFEDDGPTVDVTVNGTTEPTITLTTTDDGTEGSGQTFASTSANFGGSFGLAFTPGADGATTPSLSFTLATTGGDSLLDSHGVAINLYLIDGKVVGSTATSIGLVAAANTVFDVSVNASGVVTLTQYAQIDHPTEAGVNDAPFADQLASLADGAITLTASATITDNDNDTDSDSETISIGANLNFADDGPNISAVLVTDARIRIDETDGVVAAGGEVDPGLGGNLGTVTMTAASLYTVSNVSVSADEPTVNSYALTLGAPVAGLVNSGLLLSTTNAPIYLWNIGGTVVGSTSTTLIGVNADNTVFDVSINSTSGAVTLTQYLAVEHPTGGLSYDEDSSGLLSGALLITVTAKDFDNDVDTATVDLGSIIRFEDDGPDAFDDSATQSGEDENVIINVFDNDEPGVDGALASSIQLVPGSQVGGGVLTNNFDGTFTLNPDPGQTGNVTFSYTFLDNDGDIAQANATIVLLGDSAPGVVSTTNLTVDEDGFGNANVDAVPLQSNPQEVNSTESLTATGTAVVNFGDDVPADLLGSIELLDTLALDNQLQLLNGAPVTFAIGTGADAGVLIGSSGGIEVIRITVTGAALGPLAGQVTYTYTTLLSQPLEHAPGAGENSDLLSGVSFQVTDSDDDTATGSFNVTVIDDVPTAVVGTAGFSLSHDESVGNQTDADDVTGPLAAFAGVSNPGDDPHAPGTVIGYAVGDGAISSTGTVLGADGGTAAFSLNVSAEGVDSLLNTTAGDNILLYKEGDLIVGRVGSQAGAAAFAIAIDPATGQVSMVQYLSIQHTDTASRDESVSILNGAVLATVTATDGDGDVSTASTAIGSLISFQDDAPVLSAASNINIQNAGDVAANGTFNFNVGTDGPQPVTDAVKSVTFSAVVNSVTVQTTTPLTQVSEDADTAVFSFSFTYSTGGTSTATNTGTITFYKTAANAGDGHAAGSYTVDLANPIAGISVQSVQAGQPPIFYDVDQNGDGDNTDAADNNIVAVSGLASDFFIQFTGQSDVTTPASDFGNNDLWGGGVPSEVKISSTAIGVFGNSVQDSDVLDYNFYTSNPGATVGAPTASAGTSFVRVTQFNGAEDFVVTLKLADPATPGTFIERTFVINADDVLTTAPAGYPALANGEGYIIFEPNDYQTLANVPDNYQIVGMQLRSSTEGVQSTVGEVYNFNGAVGASGGYDGTTAVFGPAGGGDQGTNDNDVFKILDIGVVRTNTTNQTATLTFNVTIQDGDNDELSQTVTATVTSAVDSSTPIVLDASKTSVVPVALDTNQDGQVSYLGLEAGVGYDYDGDGVKEATAWVAAGDSILVRDADANGTVTNASEFVFGGAGRTDLEALHAQYGAQLDASDADFAMFMLWNDANSDGIAQAAELQGLTAAGITSLSLVSNGAQTVEAGGDVLVAGKGSFTYANGNVGLLHDAAFRIAERETSLEQRFAGAANSNGMVAAAVAAAGLAAGQAAAHANANASAGLETATEAGGLGQRANSVAADAPESVASRPLMSNESRVAADDEAPGNSASTPAAAEANRLDAPANDAHGPTELLEATERSGDDGASASPVAPMVVMPSAAALESLVDDGGSKHSGAVEKVIAAALDGGAGGGDIDAILAALPGGRGENAALDALATPLGDAVPGWDMAHFGGLPAAALMNIVSDVSALHHDAVQPAING